MAATSGVDGIVTFKSGSSDLVLNVTAWALTEEAKVYDATVYGTAVGDPNNDDWEDYIVGSKVWSGTLSFIQDTAAAIDWSGLSGIITLYTASGVYYTGTAILSVQRLDHAKTGEATGTADFQGTGKLNHYQGGAPSSPSPVEP
jgi:hypothetical protein